MPENQKHARGKICTDAAACYDCVRLAYEPIRLRATRHVTRSRAGFLIVIMLMLSASSVQAIECRAELPAKRNGHWSYRMIEGRKCWYEGKQMISKSLLHWRRAPDVAKKQPADAKPVPAVKSTPKADPDPVPCCWPQRDDAESFMSRWQGIFGSSAPRMLFDPAPASDWPQKK